jgi:hypothetical protein
MANLEKHKKDPLQDWLEEDESTVPGHSRGSHVVGAYIKIPKPQTRKSRRLAPSGTAAPKIEAALVRDPAPPPKLEEKHSQANSPEHLKKLQRLPKLRAPFSPRHGARA